ncbi:MAG: hypothetical protein ACTSVI_10535 [Promethearchaeota archaeon]
MSISYNFKNAMFRSSLKVYNMVLAGCGGCQKHLYSALSKLPIELVSNPQVADIILVSGVITRSISDKVKIHLKKTSKPCFFIRIGKCLDKINKSFEDPGKNYSISEKVSKIIHFDLEIKGCPPTEEKIFDELERFIKYLDLTPEITTTLEKKLNQDENMIS